MKLNRTPELLAFFATTFLDTDRDLDAQSTRDFIATASPDRLAKLLTQAKILVDDPELPLEEFGSEANRWFGDEDEARAWLEELVAQFEEGGAMAEESNEAAVRDSLGALLAEGDSVQVIKDLKVRGGASDLKRGTLIKKIHLIGDPENIECRVEGSTLVLKTCFLKKA